MAVVPRSMFANDGSLLVCKEKANLMAVIEGVKPQLQDVSNESKTEEDQQESANQSKIDNQLNGVEQQTLCRVLIVDAMAILQGIKKSPGMTSIRHLKETFVKKMMNMSRRYDEVRVLFDY